jgi:hypothetical protein
MNGYGDNAHDEDPFGPAQGGIVSSFDAFRKYCLYTGVDMKSGISCGLNVSIVRYL